MLCSNFEHLWWQRFCFGSFSQNKRYYQKYCFSCASKNWLLTAFDQVVVKMPKRVNVAWEVNEYKDWKTSFLNQASVKCDTGRFLIVSVTVLQLLTELCSTTAVCPDNSNIKPQPRDTQITENTRGKNYICVWPGALPALHMLPPQVSMETIKFVCR